MNTRGISQVGTFTPDNLIAGNRHPVDVRHVIIKAGQVLERGSVLEEDVTEPGKYVLRGTYAATLNNPKNAESPQEGAETPSTEESSGAKTEAEYILAERADALAEDTVAVAYYAGEFAENALIVKEGYTITEQDRKTLRNAGIFLKTIMM